MKLRESGIAALLAVCGAAIFSPGAAQFWYEQGDAPEMLPGQDTVGHGELLHIYGHIEGFEADIYRIKITQLTAFEATLRGGTTLDTTMMLFAEDGHGIVYNDNSYDQTSTITNELTQNLPPGIYYLAIDSPYRQATSGGQPIWNFDFHGGQWAPNGPGAQGVLDGWDGINRGCYYDIRLQGTEYATEGTTPPPPTPRNDWFEDGDAPELSAQVTAGSGVLEGITGWLQNHDNPGFPSGLDVDVYVINIPDPSTFLAETVGRASFSTRLTILDTTWHGIVIQQKDPITQIGSRLTGAHIPGPGTYYLCVGCVGRGPVDLNSDPLWQQQPWYEERVPDGLGAANPVHEWRSSPDTTFPGYYRVALTGATWANIGDSAVPQSTTVGPGIATAAQPDALRREDNLIYQCRPGVVLSSSQDPLVIDVMTHIGTTSPSDVRFRISVSANQGNIRQRITAYDYNAQAYVTVDTRLLTTGEEVILLDLGTATNYIGPGGEMKMRNRYRAAGPILTYPWLVNVNEIRWIAVP